jgi:hypothetical protein
MRQEGLEAPDTIGGPEAQDCRWESPETAERRQEAVIQPTLGRMPQAGPTAAVRFSRPRRRPMPEAV